MHGISSSVNKKQKLFIALHHEWLCLGGSGYFNPAWKSRDTLKRKMLNKNSVDI